MSDYSKIESEVDAVADEIWDVASHVWELAELGMEEVQSSPYAAAALEKVGFKISDRDRGTRHLLDRHLGQRKADHRLADRV